MQLQNLPGFNAGQFIRVHELEPPVTSVRINPAKLPLQNLQLPVGGPVPWANNGYYLTQRPSFTLDPCLHAGAYYVQEASSMFLEQAFKQLVNLTEPITVLDLCAAPGGKSTHILSLLNTQSVLVSNEVTRNRVTILAENITKWGAANCIVTNNDPAQFAAIKSRFDIIVVDAPCSGSGLFRKDNDAIAEWSPANVEHCSMRQRRILQDVWPALKPGGLLFYSTCSYSEEEDEEIADWLTAETGAVSLALQVDEAWNIVTTYSPVCKNAGYRFYPHLLEGEGFFMACFKKPEQVKSEYRQKQVNYKQDARLIATALPWLTKGADLQLYRHEAQLFAMPFAVLQLFLQLQQQQLNIRKAGVKVGDVARDEVIPDHALALSTIKTKELPVIDFSKEQALAYLRRADVVIQNIPRGWLLVCFEGLSLGWIKSLGNRVNNYYPKEWRIRLE